MQRATLAESRLSDFKSMLDDIREQRDRWQQQAERLAALAITD
jgi:predicted flap endonuclease-1-like 5' DNA nuclease